MSPLRYDIVVRERFIDFFEDNERLYDDDFAEFARRAGQQPYFVWFSRIAVPRFRPHLLAGADLLEQAFEDRLHVTAELVRSFRETGVARMEPILLRTARRIEPTITGKRVVRSFYVADGCHRLALVRRAGIRVLAPAMYRVVEMRSFRPRDHTAVFLASTTVSPHEYFSFLGLGYGDASSGSKEALIEHVRRSDPERLEELRAVIAADAPLLGPA